MPEPIAIIGIGCRLPGGANSPEAFWELLRQGRKFPHRQPVAAAMAAHQHPDRSVGAFR